MALGAVLGDPKEMLLFKEVSVLAISWMAKAWCRVNGSRRCTGASVCRGSLGLGAGGSPRRRREEASDIVASKQRV